MPIRRVIVGTSPERIVDYNPKRTSLLIQNSSGSDVFIYPGPKEIVDKGLRLMAGQAFSINILTEKIETKNAWYAQTTAGTADLRIFEDFE
jgi:hypothetical protein